MWIWKFWFILVNWLELNSLTPVKTESCSKTLIVFKTEKYHIIVIIVMYSVYKGTSLLKLFLLVANSVANYFFTN